MGKINLLTVYALFRMGKGLFMDITKCLTISIAHITENTEKKLKMEPNTNYIGLAVYEKGNYGYWIFCPKDMISHFNNGKIIPQDLWNCMLLAYKNNCRWLCLDQDGEEVQGLEIFEW